MGSNRSSSRGTRRSAMSLFQDSNNSAGVGQTAANGSTGITRRKCEDKDKAVVQFGWTFHLRHANSLQYAWIWDWLSTHTGSSRQNVGKVLSVAFEQKWLSIQLQRSIND